jgi:flagellar protein FlbD
MGKAPVSLDFELPRCLSRVLILTVGSGSPCDRLAFSHLIGAVFCDLRRGRIFPGLPLVELARLSISVAQPMRGLRGNIPMIELTRLNGSRLSLNCDLIKHAESAPDTVLTLITGEKLVVLEPRSEVTRRTLDYRAAVMRAAWPDAASALSAKAARDAQEVVSRVAADGDAT